MSKTVSCYAAGRDGEWEAICLDLDIAVQGESFEEVSASLSKAISLYLESVSALSESERALLVERPAPLSVRLRFLGYALRSLLGADRDRYHHQFTMPLAA